MGPACMRKKVRCVDPGPRHDKLHKQSHQSEGHLQLLCSVSLRLIYIKLHRNHSILLLFLIFFGPIAMASNPNLILSNKGATPSHTPHPTYKYRTNYQVCRPAISKEHFIELTQQRKKTVKNTQFSLLIDGQFSNNAV